MSWCTEVATSAVDQRKERVKEKPSIASGVAYTAARQRYTPPMAPTAGTIHASEACPIRSAALARSARLV